MWKAARTKNNAMEKRMAKGDSNRLERIHPEETVRDGENWKRAHTHRRAGRVHAFYPPATTTMSSLWAHIDTVFYYLYARFVYMNKIYKHNRRLHTNVSESLRTHGENGMDIMVRYHDCPPRSRPTPSPPLSLRCQHDAYNHKVIIMPEKKYTRRNKN